MLSDRMSKGEMELPGGGGERGLQTSGQLLANQECGRRSV